MSLLRSRLRSTVVGHLPTRVRAFHRLVKQGALSLDARVSYSQEGEDLVLARLFDGVAHGIYVDVGAHHPTRFSNTALLHRLGWRGINIDATPGSMIPFRRERPNDVNLELAITDSGKSFMDLHVFDEPALNGVDTGLSIRRDATTPFRLLASVAVPCLPLAEVLDDHLPTLGGKMDVLTVDVEGHDLAVLRSNDWTRHRPKVVVVEALEEASTQDDPAGFLVDLGYDSRSRLVNSLVFVDATQPN